MININRHQAATRHDYYQPLAFNEH